MDVLERLRAAMVCETVLLGGGNAKLMKELPSHVSVGANSNAITGGIRLWAEMEEEHKTKMKARKAKRPIVTA